MEILRTENMRCLCCMEEHVVQIIRVLEHNVFKNVPVDYYAEYFYCDQADEAYADEQQICLNDIAMKNAYREKMGLPSYSVAPR